MTRGNPKSFLLLSDAYLFSIIIMFMLTWGIRAGIYVNLLSIKFLLVLRLG
jgi:hypothetical protein